MFTAYDIGAGRKALDVFAGKDINVDRGKMTATGIFAAASKDRCGDLLEIGGIDISKHKKNPVVLWLHGLSYRAGPEADFPIGKAEDDAGNYTVRLLPDQGIAVATTFFSQRSQLAEQVFALVDEGTIRGQSLGYSEKRVERMFEDEKYVGTHIIESELIEYSWCPIPMNGDAVRAALSRDMVCGKSLHPGIRSVLEPMASPRPVWAQGFSFEGAKTMGYKGSEPPPVREGERRREEDPDFSDKPDGVKTLHAMHKRYCSFKALLEKCYTKNENETVKETVAEHLKALEDLHTNAQATYMALYEDDHGPLPVYDSAKDDDTDDVDPSPAEAEQSEDEKRLKMSLLKYVQRVKHTQRLIDMGSATQEDFEEVAEAHGKIQEGRKLLLELENRRLKAKLSFASKVG